MSQLRRLRPPRPRSAPDLRPGLLSVVGLLFMLLPFLLLTTSIQRLTGIDLALAGSTGELAPLPPGTVEAVEVHLQGQDLRLRSALRTRDVTASQGDRYGHSYFRDAPTVSSDLVLLLRDDLDPGTPGRPLESLGRKFWRVPSGYPALQSTKRQVK